MLPRRALNNIELEIFGKSHIDFFRGVFMRDALPKKPWRRECGIINLDSYRNNGSHWVAYYKNKKNIFYFDSFGNLSPPLEVLKYLGYNIQYNYNQVQDFNTFNCGHLCIEFLLEMNKTN